MIRFTKDIDTRIKIYFSVNGLVQEHDIIGAICSTVASILPEYNIVALQNAQKVAQLKLDLYEHKVEKTNKVMTIGTLYLETNLDPADNALLVSLIEKVNKVHLHEAKFMYKDHEDTKENNLAGIIKRSKELYTLFSSTKKQDVRRDVKAIILENTGVGIVKTLGAYHIGPTYNTEEEVFVVEGRNDVINLVKCNYNNVLGIGGFNFIEKDLEAALRGKIVTLFLDADSGGHQNLLKLNNLIDIRYIVTLPEGKKVEDLSKKEVLEAIKNKKLFVKQSYSS